jgi:hypothetical protein
VRWQVSTDGTNYNDISGQTTTTLSFTATASQNGYKYRAVFTNPGGSVPTSAATLTVILPVLTVTVNNAERAYGASNSTFTVSYSGLRQRRYAGRALRQSQHLHNSNRE